MSRASHLDAVEMDIGPPQGKGVAITFSNLTYTVKVKKSPFASAASLSILSEISGLFPAGKMTALLGPSGSGKTTLLDVIAGRKNSGKLDGEVLFGGQKAKQGALKQAVGYVEQFDTLVGELTCVDMLMYTAELKLPADMSTADKRCRVEEVIDSLGLRKCASTVIGSALKRGISGGQAKRVNIALALITRPPLLFLDEPTSGLDSFMANDVIACLKQLASSGRTVVCTIHSPSAKAFAMFDELMMLKAGRVIFAGAVGAARPYLESVAGVAPPAADATFSLPEWLVDTTSGADALPTAELFASSDANAAREQARLAACASKAPLGASDEDGRRAGPLWQLFTLLRYRMLTHYKSGEFLGPRIGDKLLFGLLILSLYWGIGDKEDTQSITSTAALLYFVSALCGAAAFVPSLTLDRPLFYREISDGCYPAYVYYLSKFIEEALLAMLTSTLFSLTVFWSCSLQGSFFIFAVTYYLTTMTGIVLAYGVAALVPTMDAANALLPTYVTMCMYFGGFFLLFDKIPPGWYWFSWTSFLRYSWGAQMLNMYSDSAVGEYGAFWDNEEQTTIKVLDFYGMRGSIMGSIGACLGLLAGIMVVFAMCGACTLTYVRHATR